MSLELTESQRRFLDTPIHGVLSTLTAEKAIHSVPVNFLLDNSDAPSTLSILTGGNSIKVSNIKKRPTATLCVFQGASYVTISGLCVVSEDKENIAKNEAAYLQKYGKVPRNNPSRVIIEMVIGRVVSRRV